MAEEKSSASGATDTKKEQSSDKKDAGKATEKSVWEKAAETIAGDNALMSSVLKILISPITFITGAGLIAYFYYEANKQKKVAGELYEKHKELSDAYDTLKEKYKKWKTLAKELEAEKSKPENIGFIPQNPGVKKNYRSNYLD